MRPRPPAGAAGAPTISTSPSAAAPAARGSVSVRASVRGAKQSPRTSPRRCTPRVRRISSDQGHRTPPHRCPVLEAKGSSAHQGRTAGHAGSGQGPRRKARRRYAAHASRAMATTPKQLSGTWHWEGMAGSAELKRGDGLTPTRAARTRRLSQPVSTTGGISEQPI
jgi:hypothetical protein